MTTPHLAQRSDRSGRARIERVGVSHTQLRIRQADGEVDQLVEAVPDVHRARSVRRSLDRVLWQRLELDGDHGRAVVIGTRHRRPSTVPVGLASALGLLADGVPTVFRPGSAP